MNKLTEQTKRLNELSEEMTGGNPFAMSKAFSAVNSNDSKTWLACLSECIDRADLTDEERNEANTAIAWIAESLDIDLTEI